MTSLSAWGGNFCHISFTFLVNSLSLHMNRRKLVSLSQASLVMLMTKELQGPLQPPTQARNGSECGLVPKSIWLCF